MVGCWQSGRSQVNEAREGLGVAVTVEVTVVLSSRTRGVVPRGASRLVSGGTRQPPFCACPGGGQVSFGAGPLSGEELGRMLSSRSCEGGSSLRIDVPGPMSGTTSPLSGPGWVVRGRHIVLAFFLRFRWLFLRRYFPPLQLGCCCCCWRVCCPGGR